MNDPTGEGMFTGGWLTTLGGVARPLAPVHSSRRGTAWVYSMWNIARVIVNQAELHRDCRRLIRKRRRAVVNVMTPEEYRDRAS